MKRRALVWLLLVALAAPFLAREAQAFRAPQQGFVFVKTLYVGGTPAPFETVQVEKLQGNYPVPPGPYVTNGVGQIWIALYPGVYRFSVTVRGAQPSSWNVSVASRGEYYIYFYLPAPEA